MGCIYFHKNKINGYMYIGQSKCNSEHVKNGRWGSKGQGYKSNKYFWNAINKYGWNNFEHGFFEDNIPNNLLFEREKYYISLYHTYRQDPLYKGGYNLTPGGETSLNTWQKEEDIWLYTNYDPNKTRRNLINEYRKTFPNSYHTDNAISARLKTLRLSNSENVNYWTIEEDNILKSIWSTDTKELVKTKIPRHSWNAIITRARKLKLDRQVDCPQCYSELENKILFDNYIEKGADYCKKLIKNQLGIERTFESIKDHATKVLKLHRLEKFTTKVGFNLESFHKYYYSHTIKETAKYFNISESQVTNIAAHNKFKRNPKTIQTVPKKYIYCVELNRIFIGYTEAANSVGSKSTSGILACCKGYRKTAKGYHWKYIEKIN